MNNTVQLHNRVPNLLLSHSNKSRVLPITTGPPSVVTENISLISIFLSSKVLGEKSSISFPLVVPYIGFKQQSSSCTSPLLQYLATTAKRELLFTSMLLSRSYAQNIRCF